MNCYFGAGLRIIEGVIGAIFTANPFFASCLASSLLMLAWRWFSKDTGIRWAQLLLPPVWSVVSTFVLGGCAVFLPVTLDRYLFVADGAFGFQASFAGAQFLLAHHWLLHTCAICYFNLPAGMTLVYLLLRRFRTPAAAYEFVRFAVYLAVAGTALYFVCPAVGPGGAFPGYFPGRVPTGITPVASAMPFGARNCMPSLHTAWILCLLWCAPPLGRAFRALLWAFSAFTLLYALSAGGHYLVDLVVAVPFTQAVRLAVRSEWRRPALAFSAATVVLWLLLLRYGIGLLTAHAAVTYAFTLLALASIPAGAALRSAATSPPDAREPAPTTECAAG